MRQLLRLMMAVVVLIWATDCYGWGGCGGGSCSSGSYQSFNNYSYSYAQPQYYYMEPDRVVNDGKMGITVYTDDPLVIIFINSQPTKSTGKVRTYESPGQSGYRYPYTVSDGTHTYSFKLQVGQRATVDLRTSE